MKAVIQRVKYCKVLVDDMIVGEISKGILIFLGIGQNDTRKDADYLAEKIPNLRIFEDDNKNMNLSANDLNKEICIVPQFTLYGDCSKGRRPNFMQAAPPGQAEKLYNYFVDKIKDFKLKIATGKFKTKMDVDFINDGPVTLLMDTRQS
ncbi:MAG: D-aminoacyl-tRNA deacylase [Halanaerobiaceae bacterium]